MTEPAPVGRRIDAYRLLHKIGEGGMGEVWLAEQTHPVRRRVALKVIKAGMDTAQVVARFEAERQALALMDHPAIATVFDGGSTAAGQPFFAMEYVKGEPITTFCDHQRLTTPARLAIFVAVCEAVQHAHQKGVIHRDLKPSNVLVTLRDGQPAPKIIDFGVAKAITRPLTERPLFTEVGMLVGTPEYMSPEQADLTALDVDTRTDVYALGVMLYELLTGALPFDHEDLRGRGLDEIRRTIREVEPPRPSTRVTPVRPESTQAARNRGTEPARLASQLRGDLDWITMKALEKDRSRRYESASALAADVGRHLRGEPVLAGPPGAGYRLRKFVARHRFGVAVTALALLLLGAFAATTTVQAMRIARERDRANAEAAAARQVSTFLRELFSAVEPGESRGDQIAARELLDRGAATIAREFAAQPQTRLELMATMAGAYRGLGLLDQALPLSEEALATARRLYGDAAPETAAAMEHMAALLIERGDYVAAAPLAQQSLEVRRRRLGPGHADVAASLDTLGVLHYYRGEFDAALPLLQQAVQVRRAACGGDDRTLAHYQQDLALTLMEKDRLDEAEATMRDNLAIERRLCGDVHPAVVSSLNNLASLLLRKRDFVGAEPIYRQAIDVSTRLYGEENRHTALYIANLGYTLQQLGRRPEALTLLRRALEIRRKVLPAGSAELGHSLLLLGRLLLELEDTAAAEPLLREVADLWRRTYAPGNLRIADADSVLGACLTSTGSYTEAEPLLRGSFAAIAAAQQERSNLGEATRMRLIALYEAWGKPEAAAEWRVPAAEPDKR